MVAERLAVNKHKANLQNPVMSKFSHRITVPANPTMLLRELLAGLLLMTSTAMMYFITLNTNGKILTKKFAQVDLWSLDQKSR